MEPLGKNAEKIGENGTLWAVSSMSPCVNGLLRGQIRKKNGKNSTYPDIGFPLDTHQVSRVDIFLMYWLTVAAHVALLLKVSASSIRILTLTWDKSRHTNPHSLSFVIFRSSEFEK